MQLPNHPLSVNRRTFLKKSTLACLVLGAGAGAGVISVLPGIEAKAASTTGNLMCLKVFNTSSGTLEAHALSAASNYQQFSLQTGTPLSWLDAATTYRFAVGYDADIVGVKVAITGTGRMEVHTLSAASNYQRYSVHAATPISQGDAFDNFAFATASNGDLLCLKASNTGSGNMEVHILTAASNYQQFSLETRIPIPVPGRPLPPPHNRPSAFAFTTIDRDLVAVKLFGDSGRMEVHVLTAASNYQQFRLQIATPIGGADAATTYMGFATTNGDLVCVKGSNTGSGRMEVHTLTAASNYQQFSVHAATPISQDDAPNFVIASANA